MRGGNGDFRNSEKQLFHFKFRAAYEFHVCIYVKVEGKIHPMTGHEGPVGEQRYSSTFSLTSALDDGGWLTPRPGRFTHGKQTQCTHCIGGWVGPRAGLDRCGKSRHHRDTIPGPSSLTRVYKMGELTRFRINLIFSFSDTLQKWQQSILKTFL